MVWFIVWRTADRPTERASNVNGGRKEGRSLKGGRIIGHEIVCAALSLSTLPLPLGTLDRVSSLILH